MNVLIAFAHPEPASFSAALKNEAVAALSQAAGRVGALWRAVASGACGAGAGSGRLTQNGASPSIVVRFSRRRRWSGVPPARCISERLSQNTMSPGCQRWR